MLSMIGPDVNARKNSFARGLHTGLLTVVPDFFCTPPVVGDVASLAIVNLSERSRLSKHRVESLMSSEEADSLRQRSFIGSVSALIGSRIGSWVPGPDLSFATKMAS